MDQLSIYLEELFCEISMFHATFFYFKLNLFVRNTIVNVMIGYFNKNMQNINTFYLYISILTLKFTNLRLIPIREQ